MKDEWYATLRLPAQLFFQPSRRASAWDGLDEASSEKKALLLLFLHLAPRSLGLLNDLVLQLLRDDIIMVHFHREAAPPLRHRSEVGAIRQHFRHGRLGLHDRVSTLVVHPLDASAAAVEIAHDGAGELVRHRNLSVHR